MACILEGMCWQERAKGLCAYWFFHIDILLVQLLCNAIYYTTMHVGRCPLSCEIIPPPVDTAAYTLSSLRWFVCCTATPEQGREW